MRFLNGFILIGIMLLVISIAGAATGNRFLTEPGQAPNPFAWLEYLGAAALMLINGAVSIWNARQNDQQQAAEKAAERAGEKPAVTTEVTTETTDETGGAGAGV